MATDPPQSTCWGCDAPLVNYPAFCPMCGTRLPPPMPPMPARPPCPPDRQRPGDFSLRYEWFAGALPPPGYWEYSIAIGPDGSGELEVIADYPSPATPRWTERFRVEPSSMDRLFTQISDLIRLEGERDEAEPPLCGGDAHRFVLHGGGREWVVESQIAGFAVQAVRALVPEALWATMQQRRDHYVRQVQRDLDRRFPPPPPSPPARRPYSRRRALTVRGIGLVIARGVTALLKTVIR